MNVLLMVPSHPRRGSHLPQAAGVGLGSASELTSHHADFGVLGQLEHPPNARSALGCTRCCFVGGPLGTLRETREPVCLIHVSAHVSVSLLRT